MPFSPLLDPDAIQRAERLGVQARGVVEGLLAGAHRSPLRGHSLEFAQHREYTPGDDPRHLDWKVFGRRDRYFVKQYTQETNCTAHLLIDGSESMQYGSGAVTKLDYARTMAACLAYLLLLREDAAAVELFDVQARAPLPRLEAMAQIHQLCAALTAFQPTGATALPAVLEEMAQRLKRRGIVLLISDLFDEDEEKTLHAIRRLRFGGHEVAILHVLDPHEIEFPLHGSVEFHGLEKQGRLTTRPADVRRDYLAEFGAFLDRTRRGCESEGCQYVRVRTDQPWAQVLAAFLTARQHRYG